MKRKFMTLLLTIMLVLSNLLPSVAMAKDSYELDSNNESVVEVINSNKENNQNIDFDKRVIKNNYEELITKENSRVEGKVEQSTANNNFEKQKTNTDVELMNILIGCRLI